MYLAKAIARKREQHLSLKFGAPYIRACQVLNESNIYQPSGCRADCQVQNEWNLLSQHLCGGSCRVLTRSICSHSRAACQVLTKSDLFQVLVRKAFRTLNGPLKSELECRHNGTCLIPATWLQSKLPCFKGMKLIIAARFLDNQTFYHSMAAEQLANFQTNQTYTLSMAMEHPAEL